MALTGTELVDEVQALIGRPGDTALCITARVVRWLNEGQKRITRAVPGLSCLDFDCTGTHTCISDQVDYAISDITTYDTTTDHPPCHLYEVQYVDGNGSYKLKFLPPDEFDDDYPDPTNTDFSPDKPVVWTKRGNSHIEISPRPSTDYAGKGLRIMGGFYPADLTYDTAASDLSEADEGLIFYAAAKAWGAIGNAKKSDEWKGKYNGWLGEYKADSDMMWGWEANLYG